MSKVIFEDVVEGVGDVVDGKFLFRVVVDCIDNIYIFKCFQQLYEFFRGGKYIVYV